MTNNNERPALRFSFLVDGMCRAVHGPDYDRFDLFTKNMLRRETVTKLLWLADNVTPAMEEAAGVDCVRLGAALRAAVGARP
jgi:hypothetical protein